jgi:hypothetical protein
MARYLKSAMSHSADAAWQDALGLAALIVMLLVGLFLPGLA